MQEPRRARHAVSATRTATCSPTRPTDPKRWKDPDTLLLHQLAARRPRRLQEAHAAVRGPPGEVHRQEGALLRRVLQRRGDRGDALRPHARGHDVLGRYGVRGQRRGRDPVRHPRRRERPAGLPAVDDREGERARTRSSPTSRARRSRTPRPRRTRATSRRARCSPPRAWRPTRTTSRAVLGQAREVGDGRGRAATTTPRRSRPTSSSAWPSAAS